MTKNIVIVFDHSKSRGGYHVVSAADGKMRSRLFKADGEDHRPTERAINSQVCPDCGAVIGFGDEARHSCENH